MLMKSVFLAVSGRSPQLLGGENAIAFEDMREGEEKKPGGGCSDWSSMLLMYVLSGYS
jgi:hypothetical protein